MNESELLDLLNSLTLLDWRAEDHVEMPLFYADVWRLSISPAPNTSREYRIELTNLPQQHTERVLSDEDEILDNIEEILQKTNSITTVDSILNGDVAVNEGI